MNLPVTSLARRTAAAVLTTAAAAALVVTGAPGISAADMVGPINGESDAASFQRSVSGPSLVGGTVARGDVVTITNKLSRKMAWLVYSIKDTHPTCFEAVPNTSTWKVNGKTYTNDPEGEGTKAPGEFSSGAGWAMIDAPGANSWQADPLIWTQDYLVGSSCELGPLNSGGLEWSTTWAFESGNTRPFVGPMLNVVAGRPSITINPTDALAANDVFLTVSHPEGVPGAPVVLTIDGKTVDGCGNLKLDGNRRVTCTWVPKKKGDYTVKAVVGTDSPVTITQKVHINDSPAGSLGALPGLDSGSLYTGSLGGLSGS